MRHFLLALLGCVLALATAPDARAIDRHVIWHEGRQIEVSDQGGWAVFEGDIIIGRTAEVLQGSRSAGPNGERIGSVIAKANTLGSAGGRWPRGTSGLFEVPYVIESDPDGAVPAAVALFNQQLSGFMQAVPRTSQGDYVAFTLSATDSSGACSSHVGRIGGRQEIEGSRICTTGVLVHEIGHAIGLWHEQTHGDAATYVQVRYQAVDPSRVDNYETTTDARRATPYDFASLMHYTATNFARQGEFTLETIPAGIFIGQRTGFSVADLEGIRRLYGEPPQRITVTSFPAGLTVVVNGASVTTPVTFDWAIGSTHTLDVPPLAQAQGSMAYTFGRWNVDAAGDLAARRVITVAAGDGTITAPTSAPAVSTYVASFVRHKQVSLGTSGSSATVTGSVVATPPPSQLPGLTATYYRERLPFAVEGIPNGNARLGGWGGGYSFLVAHTTAYSSPFRGPVAISDAAPNAYEYRALFVDFPFVTVRARAQDGDVLGVRASIARTGMGGTTERLPYNTISWPPAESATVSVDVVQSPFSSTMRYVFVDWDGFVTPSISVTGPGLGGASRTLTANFSKEYKAFREVIPSCGGVLTLPGGNDAWFVHGSNVSASILLGSGWVMTGWEGSVSGTSTLAAFTVTTHPQVIARLNTVAEPLRVASVSPSALASGQPANVVITGSGFTPASEVYVAGVRQASQFVSSTLLTASVPAAGFPGSGLAVVTVTNRPSPSSGCSVSATGKIDLVGSVAAITPQTGWWWNSAESGRGFFIEKRGGNLFMAGYYYEADGRATWFSAGGAMQGNSFTGDMVAYRGGQSLTGAYVSPITTPSPGRITLAFDSASSATLTWPGGVTPLTRFAVGPGSGSPIENGWWWNPAEPGRGFSIEMQGGAIFIAGFMYDTAGNPLWYFSQGAVDGSGAYNGAWLQAEGGQTLGGAYRPPTFLPGNAGSLALAFSGTRNGTLNLPNGRQIPITRFEF